MIAFWWANASRWPTGAPAPNPLSVIGWALVLGAMTRDQALADIRRLDLVAAAVPDPALGHYPMAPDEVDRFLAEAGVPAEPAAAAQQATAALAALREVHSPVDLAANVLDVWKRAHASLDLALRHDGHCDCLMSCPVVPPAIRALDAAVETYYEAHHESPTPECFGWSDADHARALRGRLAACAAA